LKPILLMFIELSSQFNRKLLNHTRNNSKKNIFDIFTSYAKDKGGWFNIFEIKRIGVLKTEPFNGSFKTNGLWGETLPNFDLMVSDYVNIAMKELHATIKSLATNAENLIRKEYGLPEIEESWRTEKLLFRRIKNEFPDTEVILHGQPEWLGKQHFDIWIPKWKIAIEYQGIYHFEPINGMEEFNKGLDRDKRKMDLAIRNGVDLFLETSSNHDELITLMRACIAKKSLQ
jgi:hypothetical protein